MFVRTALVGALALTFACVPPQSPEPSGEPTDEMGARLDNLSDHQIAGVAISLHNAEIHSARLALDTAEDPRVIALAERLIREHAEAAQELRDLAAREGLEFRDTQFSRDLDEKFLADREEIDHLRGEQFDRAYVQQVIDHHREAIDLVEDHLEPAADANRLEDALDETVPMLGDHLAEARRVQARLLARG